MLAPFSAPSRGIAVLILPGGPLRFQIGEVTGVSTCESASALTAPPSALTESASSITVSVIGELIARVIDYARTPGHADRRAGTYGSHSSYWRGLRAMCRRPRELAKKVGVEIKHLYLASGESDLVIFVDAPSGDNVAKFALAVSSLGYVRTRTARAWSADEYRKIISELP
jgi:uncharacterized protein with GYD domain